MDYNVLFVKLKELGSANSEKDSLIEHCAQNIQQIIKFLPRRILNADGGQILDYIFNGLSETTKKYTIKIIDIAIKTMRKESTSLTHCADIVSRLSLELPQLPADDLVKWCNESIQSVVEDSDVNMIWRDIIPECISSLQNYDTIKHYDTEMTSGDYKTQCVHTLCQFQWKEEHLVQLAAMFTDMNLSRVDHTQVVNKMCSFIIKVAPETLPPLTLQLMRLCKFYNLDIVLSHLSHYFNVSLFGKLEPPPQDSESTTMDVDDIVPHTTAEFSQCLSNCIFHISQGPVDPELVRKHLKMWPKTQLLRSPFLIDLALVMSDKGTDYKTVCLNIIKSAIEFREMDDIKRKKSAWARSILPPDVDIVSLLKVITTDSANYQLSLGLINLAFSLLSVSSIKPVAASCWTHGKLILVRLSKSQRETVPYILNNLADRLAGHNAQKQYADCLHVLCKLTPASVEGRTELSMILENCQPLNTDYRLSANILDSVRYLINFSTRTRDTLVMVCRKGLYSRDSYHRCLALSGFLTVLRHVRLSRSLSCSQSENSEQFSANSYLTQIAVDFHASQQGTPVTSRVRNEAVCMEVVTILRRCLMQDALVKELLYTKLYGCSQEKIALHELILELFYEHLSKYLSDDNNSLLLDKCVQVGAVNATLIEPISYLLYAVSQFLQPEMDDDEDILASNTENGTAYLKNKLNNIMLKLCASPDIGHISMDDPGLTDLTPESKAKCLKVQQMLQVYESLIAYQIMQWNANSTEVANNVYKLFKDCEQLLEKTKAPSKLAKKRRKSINETKDTIDKSQKSQAKAKEKAKSPKKLSVKLFKDRGGPFKPLVCLWDLKLCVRIAELLYGENVPWSSTEQRNQLRSKRDFHHWTLRSILSVLAKNDLDKRDVAIHGVTLCHLLYSRCICRFREMCEFDDQTTLNCIDVFRSCLSLLFSNNYSFKLDFFLPKITDQTEVLPSTCVATILEQLLTCLTQMEDETSHEGSESKKLMASLVNTVSLILEQPVITTAETTGVIVKLEDYIRKTDHDCLSMLPALLTAGCREQQEALFLEDLLNKLTEVLGKIDEEDTSRNEESSHFSSITDISVHTVLNHVCLHLYDRMMTVEHLLLRARDLNAAISSATQHNRQRIERELKELYESTVIHMCRLCTWISRVVSLRCCIGPSSSRVLGTCVKLYSVLATLAKQINVAIAKNARFDRLLKLSGKKLSTTKDNFITYLGSSQELNSARKVERDTKLIPKLVHEAEQYAKHVILLADKAELNWQQYLSLGTSRDFRINGEILQQVLNIDDASDDNDETRDDINDAETVHLASGNEEELDIIEDGGSDKSDDDTTDRKRKRK